MSYLTPLLAIVAAGIALPTLVILYFLKLRRRDVEISTTLLWKKSIQDMQANAPFQRLRRNILLLLQLLALGGVLFAVAQPILKRQSVTGTKHAILIDRSASMNATDEPDGKGGSIARLEAAKKQALALVDSMRDPGVFEGKDEADEAMLITFAAEAEVRLSLTSDKSALKAAIEGISPTDAGTNIKQAMDLARAHAPKRFVENEGLRAGEPITIHVWSDGKIADVDKARSEREDSVEYKRLGSGEAENVAITALRAERAYADPNSLTIFVGLQNNRPLAREVDVELVVDGRAEGLRTVRIGAASSSLGGALDNANTPKEGEAAVKEVLRPGVGGTAFLISRPEGAVVQVTLREPGASESPAGDVLVTDNRAWLVVPPARRLSVLSVGKGNLFLSSLLSGLPLANLKEVGLPEFEQMLRSGEAGRYDVVILDGVLPTANIGATGLPPGNYLVLGAVPVGVKSGITDKGRGAQGGIIDWEREHPVLQGASLDALTIAASRIVEVAPGSASRTIAMSDKGPAIIELSTAETRAIIVPFDPGESTWPFDVSFVIVTASSVNYLGEQATQAAALRSITAGSTLSDRLPGAPSDIEIELPGRETRPLTLQPDGTITYGPIAKTGVYRVSWVGPTGPTDVTNGSRSSRFFACNLLDAGESDLASAPEMALASSVVSAQAGSRSQGDRKLWPWFLLGALGIVMVEWYIYNRKVHV